MKNKRTVNVPKLLICVYAATLLYGCGVTGSSSKFSFNDGYYYSKLTGKKIKKYYVVTGSDSIKVYPPDIAKKIADTVNSISVLFPSNKEPANFKTYTFLSNGFDLDVITILFKYRPPIKDFPAQFNSNFNGAFYTGYRIDQYNLNYDNTLTCS